MDDGQRINENPNPSKFVVPGSAKEKKDSEIQETRSESDQYALLVIHR